MIFPIPKKETYSDGRYAVASGLASLSLVDLFAAVKDGKAEIAISIAGQMIQVRARLNREN